MTKENENQFLGTSFISGAMSALEIQVWCLTYGFKVKKRIVAAGWENQIIASHVINCKFKDEVEFVD
jgi:hypothetical protein